MTIFEFIALGLGYLVLTVIVLGLGYAILCAVVEHLAGSKGLGAEIDRLKQRQRDLEGTIGELRYKVEKYQRTKEYHKEGSDDQKA